MFRANGPFRARKGREESERPLLDDLEVLIDGPNRGLNKPNVEDLVLRAGGTTISNKEMFLSGNRLVIVNNVDDYDQEYVRKMQTDYSAAVVNWDWLTDTVSGHRWRLVH